MTLHHISEGLDLPIAGRPEQRVFDGPRVGRVALLGADYHGLVPRLAIEEGATVASGELLFESKNWPGVKFTAPGSGTVAAIVCGERRSLVSVVIELDEAEREPRIRFSGIADRDADALKRALLETGLWPALRARPFDSVADPRTTPHSLFVTAVDTEPLAPDVATVPAGCQQEFEAGLKALSMLTPGPTYLCKARGSTVGGGNAPVTIAEFEGPHPMGNVGVHIHQLDPVHRDKIVWHLGYQDVVAVGQLVRHGFWSQSRVIALAGPGARRPRLLKTRIGASVDDLVRGETNSPSTRTIAGSILNGRQAHGRERGYLGRYHRQISLLEEGNTRELLGWLVPGRHKFSALPVTLGAWFHRLSHEDFELTTAEGGSRRAIIPIGAYERVMPMDILPTHLLRALAVGDIARAEALGALELVEEDRDGTCRGVCDETWSHS